MVGRARVVEVAVSFGSLARACVVGVAVACGPGGAPFARGAEAVPSRAVLAAHAAGRYPQPVRVGDLVGRDVLKPVEAQPVLGQVVAVVKHADGFDLVMRYGGLLGIGGHLVEVPLDAAALLGEHVAMMELTPEQLDGLPTVPAPADALPGAATVTMGLVRPFH